MQEAEKHSHAISIEALNSIVPVSQFNSKDADGIFDRLKTEHELVVIRDDAPTAVLLSIPEYTRLKEAEEDYALLQMAQRRFADTDWDKTVSREGIMEECGISQAELDAAEEPEIE